MEARLRLDSAAKNLIGLDCQKVKWGTGSIIKLGFTSSIENRDTDIRTEHEILVSCAWRVMAGNCGLFTWRDVGARDEMLGGALNSLIGTKVSDVTYDPQTHDLFLVFENNFEFHILCDVANDDESDENYVLYSSFEILYVDFEGNVKSEQYKKH
jgi:hypothetical protein